VKGLRPACVDWTTDSLMAWFRNHQNDEHVLKDVDPFGPLIDSVGERKQSNAISDAYRAIQPEPIHPHCMMMKRKTQSNGLLNEARRKPPAWCSRKQAGSSTRL
jgi:hypothetical protein